MAWDLHFYNIFLTLYFIFFNMRFSRFTILLFSVLLFVQCKKEGQGEQNKTEWEETAVSGRATILVEESIYPIVLDVQRVFENEYDRVELNLIVKSENEILSLLKQDSLRIAVLPRKLDNLEVDYFRGYVVPNMTHFATDGIALIVNENVQDSLLSLDQLLEKFKGNVKNKDTRRLVFDNRNSNIVNYFRQWTEMDSLPNHPYVSFGKTSADVIKMVQKQENVIGVIGMDWLVQPTAELKPLLNKVKIVSVYNKELGQYIKPNQNNLGEGVYPLARDLYVIDLQGKSGLGKGFSSYIAGYKGQRIVLKSGLLPFQVPPREIVIIDK